MLLADEQHATVQPTDQREQPAGAADTAAEVLSTPSLRGSDLVAAGNLLLQGLSPQQHLLLHASQQQRAAAAKAAAAASSSNRQQEQQQADPSVAADQALAGLGSSAAEVAPKVDRLLSEVDRLVSHANALRTNTHQGAMRAAESGSALFGNGSGLASSSGGASGGSSKLRAGGDGDDAPPFPGQQACGGSSRNGLDSSPAGLSELLALFADSPLFRGGPVPRVQLLHQR
jgi:hypothetical protein